MNLDMFSNVLDPPVVSIFSPLMEPSFPTLLPFSAVFSLGTLMKIQFISEPTGISLGMTQRWTQSFLEKGRVGRVNCRKTISGSTHSPTAEGPQLRVLAHPWAPKPRKSICKQNLACGMFSVGLLCVSIHGAFSLNTKSSFGIFHIKIQISGNTLSLHSFIIISRQSWTSATPFRECILALVLTIPHCVLRKRALYILYWPTSFHLCFFIVGSKAIEVCKVDILPKTIKPAFLSVKYWGWPSTSKII